jgi:hypothetical protein
MTFQQDLHDTFCKINDEYNEQFNIFISKPGLFDQISLEDADVVVHNLKRYSESMETICKIFTSKDKFEDEQEDEITIELQRKMLPIMILYRQILELKHKKITSTIQYRTDS